METLLTATLTNPEFGFTITDQSGNTMQMDIPVAQGGNGLGMRPMQTVLAALCGCSAADVISILKKQKQHYSRFVITVAGEREQHREPSLWQTIQLGFHLEGDADPVKLRRAVELSIQKYCSVAETLRRAGAVISFTVQVNNISY